MSLYRFMNMKKISIVTFLVLWVMFLSGDITQAAVPRALVTKFDKTKEVGGQESSSNPIVEPIYDVFPENLTLSSHTSNPSPWRDAYYFDDITIGSFDQGEPHLMNASSPFSIEGKIANNFVVPSSIDSHMPHIPTSSQAVVTDQVGHLPHISSSNHDNNITWQSSLSGTQYNYQSEVDKQVTQPISTGVMTTPSYPTAIQDYNTFLSPTNPNITQTLSLPPIVSPINVSQESISTTPLSHCTIDSYSTPPSISSTCTSAYNNGLIAPLVHHNSVYNTSYNSHYSLVTPTTPSNSSPYQNTPHTADHTFVFPQKTNKTTFSSHYPPTVGVPSHINMMINEATNCTDKDTMWGLSSYTADEKYSTPMVKAQTSLSKFTHQDNIITLGQTISLPITNNLAVNEVQSKPAIKPTTNKQKQSPKGVKKKKTAKKSPQKALLSSQNTSSKTLVKDHYPDPSAILSLHLCGICWKKCDTRKQLCKHYKTHKPGALYKCLYCDKQLTGNGSWHRHIRLHSGKKPFACHKCNKRYTTKYGLQQHISKTHDKIRPFKCKVCSKKFQTKSHLQVHQEKIHTRKEAKYVCNICQAKFTSSRELTNHQRYHAGTAIFLCPFCSQSFTRKDNLNVHIQQDRCPAKKGKQYLINH